MSKLEQVDRESPANLARLFTLYPGIEKGWDLDDPEKRPEFHWFISSGLGWNAGDDLWEVLNTRRREDTGTFSADHANLFWVPGEWNKTEYKINQSQPVVDGLVFVSKVVWSKEKGRKS